MMRPLLVLSLALSLSSCNWIGRQADALGSHMPVIGERCEHWQCITESGRQRSDMYKRQSEMEDQPQQQVQGQAQQGQVQQGQVAQQPSSPYQQQQYPSQYQQQPGGMTPYDYYNQ